MSSAAVPSRTTYIGLFLTALATLAYEILLTRIFSVTMWYHFAFVAISIAMFGMTVGALIVYLNPRGFPRERVKHRLAVGSIAFPVIMCFSFMTQLSVPFLVHPSVVALYAIGFTYFVVSLPFVASGIIVCLALTQFPHHVGRLYAADLSGAAMGCFVLVGVLMLTDGPTSVFVIAATTTLGAVFFARDARSPSLTRTATGLFLVLALFATAHTFLVWREFPVLRLIWVKGGFEARPLYEQWNSFSRVRVHGDPDAPERPYGWGLSSIYPSNVKVKQLHMDIDVNAGTVLTRFTGDLSAVDYLKHDITNVGYHIRPQADVLIVGTGGGRDILSALTFGARSILGVEINEDILHAAHGRFGEFTGHLERYKNVALVNDEARSFIARQEKRFDVIQLSLIDTWAATAAGAFVLSENALYTVEAWKVFLEHLADRGMLMVSRWYFRDRPGEMYRLASLATTALETISVESPRSQILLVRNMRRGTTVESPDGVGTMLISRSPFSEEDIRAIHEVARQMRFEVVLDPQTTLDSTFDRLTSREELKSFAAGFPLNISAPTDDSPFFFHMLRLKDLFRSDLWEQGRSSFNMKAVFVLGGLLLTVVLLTIFCIVLPLMISSDRSTLTGAVPLMTFFAAIGLGFMLIETSQMQRLIVVLGHPTYGLSVVLFSLLLSSGLGSYATSRLPVVALRSAAIPLILLIAVLAVFGALTPFAMRAFESAATTVRILVSVAILFPIGFFMGMAFPLGMRLAADRAPSLTPWLWGINGATSVCASVLGIVIALAAGISSAFWTGVGCYVIALAAFVRAARRRQPVSQSVASGFGGLPIKRAW